MAGWAMTGFTSAPSASRTRSTSDRKSTRLNSSHSQISYAVFCLKKKKKKQHTASRVDKKTADNLESVEVYAHARARRAMGPEAICQHIEQRLRRVQFMLRSMSIE